MEEKANGVWERRTNEEVMKLNADVSITSIVTAGRIKRLRHLERAKNSRIVKRMLASNMKKKKGEAGT